MLLCVTTTSGRPKALEALERWLRNQTTEDYQWLIVCDDWEGYRFPSSAKVIKREPGGDLPSICENWLVALDYIDKNDKFDRVLCLDDDDWYHPTYLRETNRLFDRGDLVGWQEDAYYYVLARKARRCHNIGHASLACTGFRRNVLPWFREVVLRGDVFIDVMLWRGITSTSLVAQPPYHTPDGRDVTPPPVPVTQVVRRFEGRAVLADNFTGLLWGGGEEARLDEKGNIRNEHPRHVGMKQDWHGGKSGLSTLGHDPRVGGGPDIWGDLLRKWLGEDAGYYLKFTRELPRNPYPAGIMLPLPIETVN